jgi:2-polyprenyl-6-methoxyphenol hydroxylase-like FAD-dependent oxidoreductase
MKEYFDAIVVGAGPVGLLTAIELTLGGAGVLVLERLAAPSMVTKALGIGPLGVEALQRRGMGAAIAAAEEQVLAARARHAAQSAPMTPGRPRMGGHFAGLSMIRADLQAEPERRPRLVGQQAIEAMLAERVQELGIEVRREVEVVGFVDDTDGISVDWAMPSGAGQTQASYLVGCDGGRSAIRKMAGFDFPGVDPSMTMYNAVVEIDRPELLPPPGWHRTPGGVYAYGFMPNRLIMLDFSGPPADRAAPVLREEIETVLRHISGKDLRVKSIGEASKWTDNTRLADTYRRGRVLLAGDAAHIHSPFGGQGLSLGLSDAANLGWKLAAVIRGTMPEGLLDTYTHERHPVAEAVLANTLAQAAIMRPDAQSGAIRDIFANLLQFDDVNRFIGQMTSGLNTRYDFGSGRDEVGRLIGDRTIGDETLYGLMGDGIGVLLDAGGKASELVAPGMPIRCVKVDAGPSLLIRPDACIAWAADDGDVQGLEAALQAWFTS